MALNRRLARAAAAAAAFLLLPRPAPAQGEVLHLAVGDPERRDRQVPLALDAVTDTRTGELLAPAEVAGRLAGARLVLVGESHTSIEFHRAQLRLIEELVRAGREVLVGLEMYPYTEQEHLDRWRREPMTEEQFVDRSRWYDAWGYHWDYYRPIFLFARDHGLPMVAVNTPREVVSAVRKQGFEGLSAEDRAHVPETIDLESEDHRTLFRAFFADDGDGLHGGMPEEQLEAMFAAQVTWDATMAHNALRALAERGGSGSDGASSGSAPDLEATPASAPDPVLVVLVGSGHVAYGLGIERQAAAQGFAGRIASVIPIPVEDEDGRPVTSVRASYADFVWGLPPEHDPLYPTLGLSATAVADDDPRRKVIFVPEDSLAAAAGFQVGDVLVAMDGEPLPDRETFNRAMAARRWGDRAAFTVERGGETVELTAWLRREPPAASPEGE